MRVFSNTATSLDGKIGTFRHDHVRIGSDEDLRWMSEARAMADAVLVGGATFRAWPLPLVEEPSALSAPVSRASPILNVVLTRRGLLRSDGAAMRLGAASAARWPDPRVRLLVLGSDQIDVAAHERAYGAEVETVAEPSVGWAVERLAVRGVRSLLVEGGGDLIFQLLDADLLDEMYVTLCPVLIGGAQSPTAVDGRGFLAGDLRRLSLCGLRQVDQELFLHYEVRRETADKGRVVFDARER